MESAVYATTMKLDLKNDTSIQISDLIESVYRSSQDIDSFRMSQIDMESVKRSSNSPIYDAPEETDSVEGSKDLYMDKSVTECEPQLVVCDRETNHNIIKDICVDEGGPTKNKILFGRKVDAKIYNFFSYWSCKSKETTKDNIRTNVLNPPATEESDQVFSKDYRSKDFMQQNEDATQKLAVVDSVYKEIVEPGDKIFLQEFNIEMHMPSSVEEDEIEHNHEKVASEPMLHPEPDKLKNMIEDEVISSPALELVVDESNIDIVDKSSLEQENGSIDIVDKSSLPQENGSITYQFDDSAFRACGKEECCQVGGCNCDQTTQNADVECDHKDATNEVHDRIGELSFSSVGGISGHISYSGPVPYSGSISLRSDSSTASTRSFAFPILQPEWNCSPVRMAEANMRHHRGWKRHILCCRF